MAAAALYQKAHRNVVTSRGAAKEHRCSCGDWAHDWAFQRDRSTAVLYTGEGWSYSLDVADYEPMCRPCHLRLDQGPMTPEKRQAGRERSLKNSGCVATRQCLVCGLKSHQAGIGRHQKASGHEGWVDIKENTMRVGIYETVEVTDEQRKAIARQIDGDGAKARNATRDEMKAFLWQHGAQWVNALAAEQPDADEDEDLIGGAEDDGDIESLI